MGIFTQGTSNVVWCEYIVQGHAYHPQIGEFWNTITSVLFFFVFGGLGILDCLRYGYSGWHVAANVLLLVVGIGSALFHATESHLGELLDELPMSVMGLTYLFCTDGMHWLTSVHCRAGTYAVGCGVTAIAWAAYLWLHNFEIFQICFVFQVAFPAFISLFSGPDKISAPSRRYWWLFLIVILCGRAVWDYERWLNKHGRCPTSEWDPRFWLHSMWHLCSAVAHWAWLRYSGPLQRQILEKEKAA